MGTCTSQRRLLLKYLKFTTNNNNFHLVFNDSLIIRVCHCRQNEYFLFPKSNGVNNCSKRWSVLLSFLSFNSLSFFFFLSLQYYLQIRAMEHNIISALNTTPSISDSCSLRTLHCALLTSSARSPLRPLSASRRKLNKHTWMKTYHLIAEIYIYIYTKSYNILTEWKQKR